MIISLIALSLSYPGKLLAVDHLVIGELKGQTWKTISEKAMSTEAMKFQTIRWNGLGDPLTVKGFAHQEEIGGTFLDTEASGPMVGTYGFTPKFPRKAVPVDLKSGAYVAVLRKYLQSVKVSTAPRLMAAYRLDLDGDGTDEVLLAGASEGNSAQRTISAKPGDYSCVLLRCIRKGKVITIPLLSNFKSNSMGFCYLRVAADLDGDGRMEIIASDDYYEGQSASVFGYRTGVVKKLIENGAGA